MTFGTPTPPHEDPSKRMVGAPNPLLPQSEKPKEKKQPKGFDQKNFLGAKVGDKITIEHKDKIDDGWEILDIDPKTGKMQLYKNGEFEKGNVNDPVLFGMNRVWKEAEKQESTEPYKPDPSKFVRHGMKVPEDLRKTMAGEKAIPFKIGQNVKVGRGSGEQKKMENDWKVLEYDIKSGRVTVLKGSKLKRIKLDKLVEWNQ